MRKNANPIDMPPVFSLNETMQNDPSGATRSGLKQAPLYIALGSRLRGVPEVITLGVKPNFSDYTRQERESILNATMVLYPSRNYAQFLNTLGRRFFPSLETCLYADEKIKQTTLFYMVGVPHPRTRFYYHLHHHEILKSFVFPFIAKFPRASAQGRGVFKIENPKHLDDYLRSSPVAYIQEYLPHEKDLRVVLVNYEPVIAYWRKSKAGGFKTNLFQGGAIDFRDIPLDGIEAAQDVARKCRFNDVGLDMIKHRETWYVIEANMKYGRKGLAMKGLDLKQIIREKLLSGTLLQAEVEEAKTG